MKHFAVLYGASSQSLDVRIHLEGAVKERYVYAYDSGDCSIPELGQESLLHCIATLTLHSNTYIDCRKLKHIIQKG